MFAIFAACSIALPASAQQIDTAAYASLSYRHIGPPGNRASAVVGEPGNPAVAYIGAASGGIWKTADGGVSWNPIFDDQDAQAIGSLAIAPSAHNEVWAGTGETFIIRPPTAPGNGIYKSTDAGRTWHVMGLERSGHIGRIVVHPTNPDIVFACALGHAYGPQEERGVYRTTDGGVSWERVLFVDQNTGCADISLDPVDPGTVFAGMWQLEIKTWRLNSGGPSSGVFVTHDGGDTWKRLSGNGLPPAGKTLGKIAVAVAPSNHNRVYALIEAEDPSLYSSSDGGKSWKLMSRDHDMAERAPYYTRFAVSPDDENLLYFASVRFGMSRDGGATLVKPGPRAGGDNHDVWIDPTNGDRYMVAHDGGASITLNRGKSFQQIVPPIAQLYHVYTDNRIPYFVYGNRQDGYSYRGPSNSRSGRITEGHWHSFGGCESGFGIPDTVSNEIFWSGCYDGGIEVYDLETGQARNVRVWPEAGYGWAPADMKYRWDWTVPLAISPHDPNRVYAGSQYVHVTTDGGQSWREISPDLTRNDKTHQQNSGGVANDNLMTFDGAVLKAIAESPVQAGVLWTGSNDGLVHVSRDAGETWTNVTDNLKDLPPWGTVTRIEPSHFDGGTAYVAIDLHQLADFDPYVFKTTDYGEHWTRIDAGIPRSIFSYVLIVTEDPAVPGMLYVGTENGLYFTRDDGAHWQPLQLNMPHAPVSWITVQPHFGDLVVATYGRGFWILDDLTPLRGLDAEVLAQPLHLFAPRRAYRFRNIHNTASGPVSLMRGQNPRYGANIDYYIGGETVDSTVKKATIKITNTSGETISTISGPAKPGVNRAWWNLRYESARPARLRTAPPGRSWVSMGKEGWRPLVSWDLDLSTSGPLAPPGDYTVIVTVGDRADTSTVTVVKDPNSAGSEADVRAQVDFALNIVGDLKRTADLVNRIEWIKLQLGTLRAILQDSSTVKDSVIAADLIANAKQLDSSVVAIQGELYDVHLTGAREDAFRSPIRVYGRLQALLSDIAENGADFPPTDQQRAVYDVLRGRIAGAERKFEAWLSEDLQAFRSKVRSANLLDVVP